MCHICSFPASSDCLKIVTSRNHPYYFAMVCIAASVHKTAQQSNTVSLLSVQKLQLFEVRGERELFCIFF